MFEFDAIQELKFQIVQKLESNEAEVRKIAKLEKYCTMSI